MATVFDLDQHLQQKQRNTKQESVEVDKTKSLSPFALSQPLANYTEPSVGTKTASDNTTTNTNSAIAVYDVEHLATFSTAGSYEGNNRSAASNNDNDGSTSGHKAACGLRESNDTAEPVRIATGTTNNNTTSAPTTATTTNTTIPKVALRRLFELEKSSGIWTQRMQIELRSDFMLVVDCETSSIVERFERECVTKAEAFSHYNDIYNNIIVFLIKPLKFHHREASNDFEIDIKSLEHRRRTKISDDQNEHEESIENENFNKEAGELHIFQCVSHKAQQIVSDILVWKSQSTSSLVQTMANSSSTNSAITIQDKMKTRVQNDSVLPNQANKQQSSGQQGVKISLPASNGDKPVVKVASSAGAGESVPIINVNVKETVQVFNQIAALREKRPVSPANYHSRPISDASAISAHSSPASGLAATGAAGSNNNNYNASYVGVTSGSCSGASNGSERGPLSPGGQLYKQRSIRAILAPKYSADRGSSSGQKANDPDRSSNVTSSEAKPAHSTPSTASMVSSEPKSSPYHHQNHHQASNGRQAAPSNAQRSSPDRVENMKTSDRFCSDQAARQSQAQQQPPLPPTVSSAGGHHKSSNSQSRHSSQQQQRQQRNQSDSSRSHGSSSSQSQLDQVMTNESYVSVLNHCFDDIEKFIIRLQQAVAAARELQVKRKSSKRASGRLNDVVTKNGEPILGENGAPLPSILPLTATELAMLSARARGPSEDDYFEILSKFKLAFNLLAKLKGCIHEPNAPELVHFLFTPLAIIIEAARNATPPIDPALVGIPYLNQDALDLLSNCCTSKESDMWLSLGPNWTETIDLNLLRASRLPSSFQPIFSDGWAPIIGELELIGLVAQTNLHHQLQQATGKGVVHTGKDCLTPAAIEPLMNEGHNHWYRQQQQQHQRQVEGRRHAQHYGPDKSLPGASSVSRGPLNQHSTGISNGGGQLENPKSSSSHKNKRNAPNPPLETLPMESPSPAQPYLGSAQYGYIHGPNIDTAERAYQAPDHYRNGRHNSSEAQPNRRSNKQSLRNADFNHYPASSHYQLSPPPMQHNEDDSHLDIDLLAHRNANMMHSNDYTELHHDAGPSQYRADRNHYHHNHHQGYSKPTNSNRRGGNNHGDPYNQKIEDLPFEPDYLSEVDHEAILLDLGPAQTDWFFELQSRGAIIVRVLFTRDANNEKELSVRRGEILELIDDSRKWWRARNIDLQIAHVPHTIVAIMQGYQTLEELLANNPNSDELSDEDSSPVNSHRFSNYGQQRDKRNSKTAGAFRYF